MGNTYDQMRNVIRSQRYTSDYSDNAEHIQFMLEESVSDNELSIEEYIKLQSELTDIKQRRSR